MGKAKKLFTKVFRLVRAELSIYTVFHIIVYTVCSISLYVTVYLLKICGFKNGTVYTFYSMYQKYTFLLNYTYTV